MSEISIFELDLCHSALCHHYIICAAFSKVSLVTVCLKHSSSFFNLSFSSSTSLKLAYLPLKVQTSACKDAYSNDLSANEAKIFSMLETSLDFLTCCAFSFCRSDLISSKRCSKLFNSSLLCVNMPCTSLSCYMSCARSYSLASNFA